MRKALSVLLALALAVAIAAAQPKGGPPGGGKGPGGGGKGKGGGIQLAAPLKITVAGTTDMGAFPAANAGQGPSPAISWTGTPAGTQSFVLLMHDPDPVMGGNNVDVTHWLVYNIPGTATGLPAAVPAGTLPDGTVQGPNITNAASYMGPGPPAGNGPHHYTIELYALNAKLEGVPNTREGVMGALAGKVLAKGVFVATYENK